LTGVTSSQELKEHYLSAQEAQEETDEEIRVRAEEKALFEDAWRLISQDGIVNILSIKVLVLILNGVLQKWMLRASELAPQLPGPDAVEAN
jgi:hypothetical protein